MENDALTPRQRSIVPIAALTATGDVERLKSALNDGLDAGLTVNEVKEILVQMYGYAGFPRSLNGLSTFIAVVEERRRRGIDDEMGKEASPMPADLDRDAYGERIRMTLAGAQTTPSQTGPQAFAPIIDTFLKEHLFADVFWRDNLDIQSREIATVSALASMAGLAAQLQFHLNAAMNVGLTETQLRDLIAVISSKVGKQVASDAAVVLEGILASRE